MQLWKIAIVGCAAWDFYLHYHCAMSQRVKRPNRSDDGSVPTKRRKVSKTVLPCSFYLYYV